MDELRPKLMRRFASLAVLVVVACTDGQATTPSTAPTAGVVDSIVDHRAAMERFVEGLPRPDRLTGGATDADRLVTGFVEALADRDTATISGMLVSRAEYGFLYYPTSVYARAPYVLPPAIAWMLSSETSAKGLRRSIARLGGDRLELERYDCAKVEREGDNEIRSDCTITWSDETGTQTTGSLFRAMIIREGHAKFLSLAGDY